MAQTFTDFELLLIDDGSKDNSGAICDEYADQDSRIRVFHKPNGGVSSARNLGLDNARGEWISFVDSDDWIEPKYLEVLNSDNEVDLSIVTCTSEKNIRDTKFRTKIYTSEDLRELLEQYLYLPFLSAPWCKLFKSKILRENKVRFNEKISTLEDSIFVFQYLQFVNTVRTDSRSLYNYRIMINGLSKNLSNNHAQYEIIIDEIRRSLFILSNKFNFDKAFQEYVFIHGRIWKELQYIYQLKNWSNQYKSLKNLLRHNYTRNCLIRLLKDKNYGLNAKIACVFALCQFKSLLLLYFRTINYLGMKL